MSAPDAFRPVTRTEPCVICRKGDWCRRTADGAHECHRIDERAVNGYERVAKTPAGFAVFRRPEDRQSPSGRTCAASAKRPRIFDSPAAAAGSFAAWKGGAVEKIYRWSDDWCRGRIRLPDSKAFCEITQSGAGWVLPGPSRSRRAWAFKKASVEPSRRLIGGRSTSRTGLRSATPCLMRCLNRLDNAARRRRIVEASASSTSRM